MYYYYTCPFVRPSVRPRGCVVSSVCFHVPLQLQYSSSLLRVDLARTVPIHRDTAPGDISW